MAAKLTTFDHISAPFRVKEPQNTTYLDFYTVGVAILNFKMTRMKFIIFFL